MIEIKKITCEDYEDFIKMLQFRYRVYVNELSYIKASYEYELLKMEFDEFDRYSTFFIMQEDKRIVGCARIIEDRGIGLPVYKKTEAREDARFRGCKNIELGRFIIDNSVQNSKAFAFLLNETIRGIFKMECDYIFADTFKGGESSKILQKLGFKASGMEYFDMYFNMPCTSALLYGKKDELVNEFKFTPNRSQKALLKCCLNQVKTPLSPLSMGRTEGL